MISLVLIEFDSKELIQPSLIDALEVGRLLCRNVKAYAPHALIEVGRRPARNRRSGHIPPFNRLQTEFPQLSDHCELC